MANTYFQFKEFTIEQSDCANKVSTDACVFGAWLNEYISKGSIVDVGCGSGLLSLMLGHKESVSITGIEIEQNCLKQAVFNVNQSKWRKKIELIRADMRAWESDESFDFIISNPPFFNNTSKNSSPQRNIARQTESLGPKDWARFIKHYAKDKTISAFLLSNNEVLVSYQNELDRIGLNHQQIIELRDTALAKTKRVILLACADQLPNLREKTIFYKLEDESYSPRFIQLLKRYYLHF